MVKLDGFYSTKKQIFFLKNLSKLCFGILILKLFLIFQTLHLNYTSDYWDKACSYEDEEGAQQTCAQFEYYSEHFTHTANMKASQRTVCVNMNLVFV